MARWSVAVLFLILAALVACNAGEKGPSGGATIEMLDNFYEREVTRVPEGGDLTFVNDGRTPHNAVAVDGEWSTEESFGDLEMATGDSTTLTISEPGVYEFYCTFHGTERGEGMAAVLVVGDVEYAPAQDGTGEVVSRASGRTVRVPQDAPTIQEGVEAARPGDLVLVAAGVYREEVLVRTPSIVIRGADRNEVVLDGEFERSNGIQVVADGVAVENMTARNYLLNGFFWTGVTGYRASYLTAYNNADYGIYAFDSSDGAFEHSYASGSPDSGFYIGQCHPCDAVITDVVAENNALGYSGTNAGGNLFIVESTWRGNLAGIVPNTLDSELLPPERETTIVGNLIEDNDNLDAPYKSLEFPAQGNGIVLAGGSDNLVERNAIFNHANHGILVTPNLDENFWFASGNVVRDNVIEGSGRSDLAVAGPSGGDNCFEGNRVATSMPPGLTLLNRCGGLRLPLGFDLSTTMLTLGYVAEVGGRGDEDLLADVRRQPVPQAQEVLPGGASATVAPAVGVFASYEVDLESLAPPKERPEVVKSKEITVSGIVLAAPSGWQLLFGFYGYLLPVVLFAAWVAISLWDIARRASPGPEAGSLGRGAALAWIAAILLVPFVGAVAYLALGRSGIPGWFRGAIVGGGLLAYVLVVTIGAAVGGVV